MNASNNQIVSPINTATETGDKNDVSFLNSKGFL